MRFHERALDIKWKKGTKRAEKSNAIDMLCSGQLPREGVEKEDYEKNFDEVPKPFSAEERGEWIDKLKEVCVSSDAFVSLHTKSICLSPTDCGVLMVTTVPVH